ncbi:hypothetical protein [Thermococcus sp. 21S9]|uniref:hypothetical protein n=1 Tax=Thermococcus sp. 21S9 TaxID=1638223 RepID=UPI00143B7636|nr:hypothetical protein [Thermococcus sp. 21S9]NJE54352.1 hypothetical protein [Thermococcus sp. 21S9]
MGVLKQVLQALVQRISLNHLVVLWAVTLLSTFLFSLYTLADPSEAILTAVKFSFAYFLLLAIYNPYSIEASIKSCMLGYKLSDQEVQKILDAIDWAVTPKNFYVLILFYTFFGVFIAYKRPLFWMVLILWSVSAYFTQHAVRNCLNEKHS